MGAIAPNFLQKKENIFRTCKECSSLIKSANVPVAKDNRHLNLGILEQPKSGSKLRVFQGIK